MTTTSMTTKRLFGAGLLLTLILTGAASFGGFALKVDAPPSGAKGAVAVVRPVGCHQPSEATLTATAEGLVGGERTSRQVALKAMPGGAYLVTHAWPAEGAWVIAVRGTYQGKQSAALLYAPASVSGKGSLALESAGKDLSYRSIHGPLTEAEIDAALQGLAQAEPTAPASGRRAGK